ncbi:glycosyl hydrolase 53 family protein [Methanococcoides methylutens]|uniref:glycosyl hydrolase 53 family protein n=1 Tax=Methanococcoides methylutens TaxID=2226 RepID=UPI00404394E2
MKIEIPFAVLLIIAVAIIAGGCAATDTGDDEEPKHSEYDLPITERNFLIGVVPTPRSVPESTFEDLAAAYEEAGMIGEVTMIWTNPGGIGKYEKLKQNQVVTAVRVYGLKPVITLNFHTIKEMPGEGLVLVIDAPEGVNADVSDPEFRELWVSEARSIAEEFKPEYFSLGNEINDYFYYHPEDLNGYLTLYDEAYAAIKEVSPDTKVMVVFSYTHLIDNDQWDLVSKFDDRVDVFGLTTYPWKHFDSPEDIDQDYYSKVGQYTTKPIAFTEIGWISTESEKEQAEFLVRFLELTKNNDIEMVNWLFLHETDVSGGIGGSVFAPETGTIALKKADGTKKEIYDVWFDLEQVELR